MATTVHPIKEIWFTTTKKGQRTAWYYSTRAFRSFRMPLADAELMIASGAAVEVSKPDFLTGWL